MEDIQNFPSCRCLILARKITSNFAGFLARRLGTCPRLYPNKLNCRAIGRQTGLGGEQKPARIPLPMDEKKPYPREDLGATANKRTRTGKDTYVLDIVSSGTTT